MLKKTKEKCSSNNKAFTISEVMISLVVLGILASVIIPVIKNIAPDQNDIMTKKAYSTLAKAIGEITNDERNYPSSRTITIGGFSYQQALNYTSSSLSSNKFCYLLSDQLNIIGAVSCPATNATGLGTFTTSDGVAWTVYIPVSDTTTNAETTATASTVSVEFPVNKTLYSTLITIDVNGSKAPNCGKVAFTNPTVNACTTANITPDTIQVGVRYDGKMLNSTEFPTPAPAPISPFIDLGGFQVETNAPAFSPIPEGIYPNNYWAGARNACAAQGLALPTASQLQTIYDNRATLGISSGIYWGAEAGADQAWFLYFNTGAIFASGKGSSPISLLCVKN